MVQYLRQIPLRCVLCTLFSVLSVDLFGYSRTTNVQQQQVGEMPKKTKRRKEVKNCVGKWQLFNRCRVPADADWTDVRTRTHGATGRANWLRADDKLVLSPYFSQEAGRQAGTWWQFQRGFKRSSQVAFLLLSVAIKRRNAMQRRGSYARRRRGDGGGGRHRHRVAPRRMAGRLSLLGQGLGRRREEKKRKAEQGDKKEKKRNESLLLLLNCAVGCCSAAGPHLTRLGHRRYWGSSPSSLQCALSLFLFLYFSLRFSSILLIVEREKFTSSSLFPSTLLLATCMCVLFPHPTPSRPDAFVHSNNYAYLSRRFFYWRSQRVGWVTPKRFSFFFSFYV